MRSYSTGGVVAYLKEALEGDPMLADVWVSGEVASLNRSGAGHCYFTLKDERAQLRCVMFRLDTPRGGDLIAPGAQVLTHGRVSVYAERGDLQFIADAVQPEGIGAREAEFRRLREKLQAEGIFDEARKRPLPEFPRRIGVVTSASGAVWHDIASIAARRWPLAELVLAPTPVQGDLAVRGILGALQQLNEHASIDVIVLARGGGSAEELWPFNDERVARAIFASTIPVVSAVGHETDFTLADYAADRRAPTPSAAAELVTPDRAALAASIQRHVATGRNIAETQLERRRRDLRHLVTRMRASAPNAAAERERITLMLERARAGLERDLAIRRAAVLGLAERTHSLSPLGTLGRGYALVSSATGALVRSIHEVHAGDRVAIRLADGAFGAEVLR